MAFDLDQQLIADFIDTETTPLQALWARVNAQAAELDPMAAAYDNEIRKHNPKHQNGFMAVSTKVVWLTSLKVPAKSIRSGRVMSSPAAPRGAAPGRRHAPAGHRSRDPKAGIKSRPSARKTPAKIELARSVTPAAGSPRSL